MTRINLVQIQLQNALLSCTLKLDAEFAARADLYTGNGSGGVSG
jgi:hypothetical protein